MGFFEWLLLLAVQAPALIFWIAVIIFGIVMLRRGGGRAERFFIAGAGVKILGNMFFLPWLVILPWLHREDYGIISINSISTGIDIFFNVISMAGIILLIYAFWLKFKECKLPENGSTLLERGSHDTIS